MQHTVIGIMSGTSIDGLDLVLCNIEKKQKWTYQILKAKIFEYPKRWIEILTNISKYSAYEFVKLNIEYSEFIAEKIIQFSKNKQIDFIALHGHTVFHEPSKKLSIQLGSGATIAAKTGITTICDFRSFDVALNGQGAPLVPIGDKLLFNEYDFCLNLGGFANISFEYLNKRIAFDIVPANFGINYFVKKLGHNIDEKGKIGKSGSINYNLLSELNSIPFYQNKPPKSLSREWFDEYFLPLTKKYQIPINNILRTIYEHTAIQIASVIEKEQVKNYRKNAKILITGGGAYNNFLINLIQQKIKEKIIIPDNLLIDFKEALIFAFLGVLRIRNEINCLSSVTGANYDNIGGAVYRMKDKETVL